MRRQHLLRSLLQLRAVVVLDVLLSPDCVLVFRNLLEQDCSLVGFEGTGWHSHGVVEFSAGPATYIQCDELEILIGVGTGELLVVSRFSNGRLQDRWLAHRLEPLDVHYLKPGEHLSVWRIATDRGAPPSDSA